VCRVVDMGRKGVQRKKLIVLLVLAGTAAAFGAPLFDNGVLTYTVAADETETEANTFASYGTVTNGTLTLTGRLTLGANARVAVTDVDDSFPQKTCVLLSAAGGIDGTVAGLDGFEGTEHPRLWNVVKAGNTLRLFYSHGTQILIR